MPQKQKFNWYKLYLLDNFFFFFDIAVQKMGDYCDSAFIDGKPRICML